MQNQKWNRIRWLWSVSGFRNSLVHNRLLLAVGLWMCALAGSAWGQSNGIMWQVYTQINGSSLNSLTNISQNSNFPNNPDSTAVLTGIFEAPSNYGDRFGSRYRALLIPPMTGTYVFWVQGDDAAALFLSIDESPANNIVLAYNATTALYRAWFVYPSQQSSNIFLEAGRRYYLEALHSAGTGDDAFAVGWKLPNGTFEQPMSVSHLWTYGFPNTHGTKPVITTQPTNATVPEGLPVVFRVGVSNFDAITYQWQRNGANMQGYIGATLTLPTALTNDNGASYRCVLSNSFGPVTSAAAVLT
ncbi:MAG TPA: immunoglobulin domain-containing protein, partial [Methylomirabilota bacterium]|nr:immunoglobulin domain-containing protein [Methylomirabilota bacterium]